MIVNFGCEHCVDCISFCQLRTVVRQCTRIDITKRATAPQVFELVQECVKTVRSTSPQNMVRQHSVNRNPLRCKQNETIDFPRTKMNGNGAIAEIESRASSTTPVPDSGTTSPTSTCSNITSEAGRMSSYGSTCPTPEN